MLGACTVGLGSVKESARVPVRLKYNEGKMAKNKKNWQMEYIIIGLLPNHGCMKKSYVSLKSQVNFAFGH